MASARGFAAVPESAIWPEAAVYGSAAGCLQSRANRTVGGRRPNRCFCEGFRMPAVPEGCRVLRWPAYENLQGKKPRERVGVAGRRALWGFECSGLGG
jgi:hypothetical protein